MPPLSPQHVALGHAIRRRRKAAGLSQTELADSASCTRNWLSEVELGHANPTFSLLLALAAALKSRAAELVAEAEAVRG